MCGIVAYKGNRNAEQIVLNGLKILEYRGYDSWGLCSLKNNQFNIIKKMGKIGDVNFISDNNANIAIGHTRWSTHGEPSDRNAHPHTDCNEQIAVVHNGIIENYQELKSQLIKLGHKFKSETDTEVIAHLIEEQLKTYDLIQAIKNSLNKLDGTFALAILKKDQNKIIAARKGSPLVIGIGNDEYFIASDVPAFLEHTKNVIFLDDNEMIILNKELEVYNFNNNQKIDKKINKIEWNIDQAQKGNYEHFMLKEIFEQPKVIQDTLAGRIKDNKVILEEINNLDLKKFNRIVITACGTAYHAGMIGSYMIEELAKIKTDTEYASEFRYRNLIVDEKTLVIAITQSGETADTLAAIREAKNKRTTTLAICNVMGATIARESDYVIYTRAGPEIGVASTKAFTCQLTVLYLLANLLADKNPEEIEQIPDKINNILKNNKQIKQISKNYYKKLNFLYLGRGSNYPIAMEGALKLKEISYIHAEGQSAAEMKHGPIALIDQNMPSVFIGVKDKTYSKIIGNIEEVKARGGKVITIATEDDQDIKKISDEVIEIPKTIDLLQPILTVIPTQLLAYHIANFRECDIDKPRNLAKSVTVE